MAPPSHSPIKPSFSHWWTGRSAIITTQLVAAFLLITLLNVGYYAQREFSALALSENLPNIILLWDGFEWYTWLLAVPTAVLLIRKYPLVQERTASKVAQLFVGGFLIYLVVSNTRYLLRLMPNLWLPPGQQLPFGWRSYLHTQITLAPVDFLTLGLLFASSFAVDYYFQYRQRTDEAHRLALRASHLQSELVQAQLTTLSGQLQPHFLFNAFNAIAMLVRQKNNEVAVETISRLSSLLRFAMERADQQEVTLDRELEFTQHYLAVEGVRFHDKLTVTYEVAPETRRAFVPNLLIQPFVGNSIKHAISRRTTPGLVRIVTRRELDRLIIEVTDDGPGESPGPALTQSTGIGLTNTRARLHALYHGDFRLELTPRSEGGMLARIDLPWRTEPSRL